MEFLLKVDIYADGACRGNPGRGGWGVLLRYQSHEKTLRGYEPMTTNNRMELMAVIQGLQSLKRRCEVHIYSDSKYVCQGLSEWLMQWKKNNWRNSKKEAVKNADLWQQLDKLAQQHQIKCTWIKGHAGHPENELVDLLANQAIDDLERDSA